jgi:hypothetical protein
VVRRGESQVVVGKLETVVIGLSQAGGDRTCKDGPSNKLSKRIRFQTLWRILCESAEEGCKVTLAFSIMNMKGFVGISISKDQTLMHSHDSRHNFRINRKVN